MKTLFQIALTLTTAASAFCHANAQDDMTAQTSSTHQAYIMVVGPKLGADNSSTVVGQCQDLACALKEKDPTANIIVHDTFSLPRLEQEVSQLRKTHGDKLHLTCIVNAHGYDIGGQYHTLTHHGLASDTKLKSVLAGCTTSLALLTCNAGAFVDDSDRLEVFGGSSNSTPLYEFQFQNWLKYAQSSPFLVSAKDFSTTWGLALAQYSQCPQEEYPFWNSTMVENTVSGTKIKTKAG
jgi:hypothetical protein